jgi:hypothetical protein
MRPRFLKWNLCSTNGDPSRSADEAKSNARWRGNVRSKRERLLHERHLLGWFHNAFATIPCSPFNTRGATSGMMVAKWVSVMVSFSPASTRNTMTLVNAGCPIKCRSARRAENKRMHRSGLRCSALPWSLRHSSFERRPVILVVELNLSGCHPIVLWYSD